MRLTPAALLLCLLPLTAFAKADVELDLSRPGFIQQKAAIEKAISTSDDLREMSQEDRKFVLSALANIESQLGANASLATLDAGSQAALLADQKAVNDSLDRASADSRMVCRSEHVIGSIRPKRVCQTVAAKRRQYELTQSGLANKRNPVSLPPETN